MEVEPRDPVCAGAREAVCVAVNARVNGRVNARVNARVNVPGNDPVVQVNAVVFVVPELVVQTP